MRAVYITSDNHRRLEEFLRATGPNQERDRQALRDLQNELDHAQIVSPEAVPPDVVTMHSHVRVLDLDTGEEMLFRLVFPTRRTSRSAGFLFSPLWERRFLAIVRERRSPGRCRQVCGA